MVALPTCRACPVRGPFLLGYLKDFTGSSSAGMYLLAAALHRLAVTVPAKSVAEPQPLRDATRRGAKLSS
ncbi:hypothetical protein GGE16_004661 [Rhizobium leguminosarum]|uniref:Uncharacterized protein n=1 Tax=Rhizobium leguminosarum TaxID=384 RepID=A0AAE2MNU3_RHILE|nr:hypothetical protein [Rhizobium leguminosarum]MBB4434468.1 hypothetical protein [Rhizobium esperanzae]MBB4298821.1 hypothetical protein [Rhizobium leguminosarum]MBB4310206.1 hypothetical protein [Rhizobium leguminosarum]MBB4531364.1 hypothetical protein [Rhizobium leguminosarum]